MSLSSSIADVFRWISSSTILVFLIALFFYENISELCRHKGWNRLLVHAEGLARKMSSILPMRWFWFVFGFVSGVAAITWLFWFFPSLTIPSRPMEISNALVRRQILETNRKNISQELLQIRQFKDRTLAAYIKCLRSENEKGSYAGPHEGCAFEMPAEFSSPEMAIRSFSRHISKNFKVGDTCDRNLAEPYAEENSLAAPKTEIFGYRRIKAQILCLEKEGQEEIRAIDDERDKIDSLLNASKPVRPR